MFFWYMLSYFSLLISSFLLFALNQNPIFLPPFQLLITIEMFQDLNHKNIMNQYKSNELHSKGYKKILNNSKVLKLSLKHNNFFYFYRTLMHHLENVCHLLKSYWVSLTSKKQFYNLKVKSCSWRCAFWKINTT